MRRIDHRFPRVWLLGFLVLLPALLPAQTLEEAWNLAEGGNPGLHAARLEEQIAADGVNPVRKSWWPQLSAGASFMYNTDRPGMTISPSPLMPPVEMELGAHDHYDTSLTLTQPVWTGGRIENSVLLSQQDSLMAGLEYTIARDELRWRIADSYIALALTQLEKEALRTSLERLETQQQRLRSMLRSGQITPSDTLQLHHRKLEIRQELLRLDERRSVLLSGLQTLVGQEVNPDLPEVDDSRPLPSADECYRLAVEHRPELRALVVRQEGVAARAGLIRAQRMPQVQAALEYHIANPGVQLQDPEWGHYVQGGIRFSWQLWDMGRTRDREKLAYRSSGVLEQKREEFLSGLRHEIDTVYQSWSTLDDQLRIQQEIERGERVLLSTAIERHDREQGTVTEIRDAEAALTLTQRKIESLHCQKAHLRLRLRRITGWTLYGREQS